MAESRESLGFDDDVGEANRDVGKVELRAGAFQTVKGIGSREPGIADMTYTSRGGFHDLTRIMTDDHCDIRHSDASKLLDQPAEQRISMYTHQAFWSVWQNRR